MARIAGSEDKGAGKGAAGVDHNVVVTEGSFLQAAREIAKANADAEAANVVRKAVRKKWKGSGIMLTALDRVLRMVEWDRQEVRESFSTERLYAQWLALPVERQMDAFKGLSDDEIQMREWHQVGKSYSRSGRPGKPPEECPPDYFQAFMRGFNEEDEAAWGDAETADVDQAKGPPPEPSMKPGPAETIEPVKAADPEPALPLGAPETGDVDPLRGFFDQPDWKGFSDDPADWFATQKAQFQSWYESVPAGAKVLIAHLGVLTAFRAALEEEKADKERAADAPTVEHVGTAPVAPPALAGVGKGKKGGAGKPVVH